MKILYLAKHGSGGADDEGAIAHALRVLGHEVECVQEREWNRAAQMKGELLLFHKAYNLPLLQHFAGRMPRVFYYPDLVDHPQDPTLASRCAARVKWMADAIPHVELGFCTDGDWVAADTTGKLHWLPQGADERVTGFGHAPQGQTIDILFTGISKGGGEKRESFVAEMQRVYGDRFRHVSHGVYGRDLADLIASAKIVVAPDGPVTNRYWSNRVYAALGFGASLLHPLCSGLTLDYNPCQDFRTYTSREHLHQKIRFCLDHWARPAFPKTAAQGLATTMAKHLYRHRCEELLRIVKARLG